MTPEAQAAQMATDDAREKVAEFMLAHSIATGHGDTIEALLLELGAHIKHREKELAQYHWRPIAEIHEDFGPCVVIDINDPGCFSLEWVTDLDFDEDDWTHFAVSPRLTNEDAERLKAEMPGER